jgi:hypothetical protein
MLHVIAPVLIICGMASLFIFGGGHSASSIVENSPYPEFIYAGDAVVSLVVNHNSENSGKNIPSFLFNFIDGVYVDAENPNQMAIKTPLWFLAKLFSNDNIHAEDGYIFINSHYVGKPDLKYVNYLTYTDAIIYSKEYIMSMKSDDNFTDVELVMPNVNESTVEMIKGLKSIGGIKVLQSNVSVDNNGVLVANMKLDAPLITVISANFDMNYVPIEVSVSGWTQKDQYTYTKGYNKLYVQVLPVDKNTMLEIIKKQMGIQNSKEINPRNGWYVEEYTSNYGKGYICCKEFGYGTVCVITSDLSNLDDVSISVQNK